LAAYFLLRIRLVLLFPQNPIDSPALAIIIAFITYQFIIFITNFFYWRRQHALVKVKQNFQITIPVEVREQLRVKEGDYLEATVRNDVVVLTPKAVVDRHMDDAIAEGMKDYREGRFIGPFESIEEFKDTVKKHS